MGKKSYIIIFAVILIAINFFLLAKINTAPITFSLETPDNITYSNLKTIELTSAQSDSGYQAELAKGDSLVVQSEGKPEAIQLLNVDAEKGAALVKAENVGQNILLMAGETKKICTDSDGIYELSLNLESVQDNNANISVQAINEKIGATSLISEQFEQAIQKLQASSKRQFYLVMFNIALIIAGILIYLFFAYVTPMLRMKKIKERENPSDAIDIFIAELKKAAKEGDKEKVKENYARIKHLYKYMTKEEKQKAKQKIDEVERYIK
jgi:hypothetical protein